VKRNSSAIFVSGVAGFIASKVAELLLDKGYQVIGMDNLNDAYDVRLKYWRLERLKKRSNFLFYERDICDRKGLLEIFKNHSILAIVNLAARAGVRQSVEDPWIYYETNVTGALNLLEIAKELRIKKFILASTSSIYGRNAPLPYKENIPTDEPLSPYAASKKAAEVLCYTYHYLYGLDISVLRYFTVYGPAGRPDMSLFRFVQWIAEERPVVVFGDGTQSRDFTYVDDIAQGTVAALKPIGYEIINLGSDRPIKLMDAIKLIEELIGKKAKVEFHSPHPSDIPATWADIEKARRLIKWEPQISFDDGIKRTVDWYIENRNWAKDIKTF